MREQLESQISRLQQENGILRDAVSSATNQMESKSVLCLMEDYKTSSFRLIQVSEQLIHLVFPVGKVLF